jgi:hypothetical protein
MSIGEVFSDPRHRRCAGRLRRALRMRCPERRFGSVRTIFLARRRVFKLPGRWMWSDRHWWWDFLLRGLLSNMQERRFAAEGWSELCPVSFSLPGGFLVVMPRAEPLADADWQELDYRAFVTRGDAYVAENFDARAGSWRQGDRGQPLQRPDPRQGRAGSRHCPGRIQARQFRPHQRTHRRRGLWLDRPN